MFIDFRNIETGTVVESDLCVIGAGAAGITIAREFIGEELRICLLESGGLDFEAQTQSLCRFAQSPYPQTDAPAPTPQSAPKTRWSLAEPMPPCDLL